MRHQARRLRLVKKGKQAVAFLKKSSAKDFLLLWASGGFNTARSGAKKFFWLLFFQKK